MPSRRVALARSAAATGLIAVLLGVAGCGSSGADDLVGGDVAGGVDVDGVVMEVLAGHGVGVGACWAHQAVEGVVDEAGPLQEAVVVGLDVEPA
jgi:hypothetical protein